MKASAITPEYSGRPGFVRRLRAYRWRLPIGGLPISLRLLLIIAFCLVPTIGLQVAVSWSQWSERKTQVGDLAGRQAALLAGDVESIGEGARLLLVTAAEFLQVRFDPTECSLRLAATQHGASSFAFIALADAKGRILCTSDSDIAATSPDASWLRDARAASSFGAGHFARSTNHPGGFLPFYLPLEGSGADNGGTLIAALDLTWLGQHLQQIQHGNPAFLAGGTLSVTDADGVVLGRLTQHSEFVGRQIPAAAMDMVRAQHPGILRVKGVDGIDRVFGYVPPSAATYGLMSAVGFKESDLMADINSALWQGAALLIAVTLVVVTLTWLAARRFIGRPTQALVAVARRWREGHLWARAPQQEESSEFGQIAAAWNEMASALQMRQDQLQEYSESLETRVAERTRDLLATNNRLQVEVAEREKTEAALLQSQKLQAVGQLAGGIAHDFNNLLATIQGCLDLLARTIPDEQAKQRAWVQRASGAVSRGAQLTGRLLAFSRRRRLSVRSTDVNQLVTDLIALFGAATLGGRISVETNLDPDVRTAVVEPSQLEAALLNLALNARDAMPEGGVLTFATSNAVLTEAAKSLPAGEYISITVADTGIGMDHEVERRAFDPFFTTKGASGSGLGLSQVQAMVDEYGGAVRISTMPGKGTCVTLLLPRAIEPASGESGSPAAQRRRVRTRVLVVDDDAEVLAVTTDMLKQLGYIVTGATSGQEALERLSDIGTPPELVVLDYAMPGMNGMTLAGALRERGVTGPIVLATGYADLSEVDQSGFTEIQAVLNKPYTISELEKLLSDIDDDKSRRTALSAMEVARYDLQGADAGG
ncbi:MAG TPA: ATP-binding protein [Acetobacteraceae bacterium]|nr:ATP-binding protein [Acetobacteraceae bacterium]